MTTKTALSKTATRYLQALKRGLLTHEVDQATTEALLADVREAFIDLSDAEAEAEISKLGPAADVARTAAADVPPGLARPAGGTIGERLCIAAALVAVFIGVLSPFIGGAVAVGALIWAVVARNPAVRRSYRTATWVAVAAIVLNALVLLMILPATVSPPTEPTVVQID